MFKFLSYFILAFVCYSVLISAACLIGGGGFWIGFTVASWMGNSVDASNFAGICMGVVAVLAAYTAFKESTN
jgi:hypothetical protein